jgi:hypothetical protein
MQRDAVFTLHDLWPSFLLRESTGDELEARSIMFAFDSALPNSHPIKWEGLCSQIDSFSEIMNPIKTTECDRIDSEALITLAEVNKQ